MRRTRTSHCSGRYIVNLSAIKRFATVLSLRPPPRAARENKSRRSWAKVKRFVPFSRVICQIFGRKIGPTIVGVRWPDGRLSFTCCAHARTQDGTRAAVIYASRDPRYDTAVAVVGTCLWTQKYCGRRPTRRALWKRTLFFGIIVWSRNQIFKLPPSIWFG